MLNTATFWQKEIDRMGEQFRQELDVLIRERNAWRLVANMYAKAEYPHERVMAFEAWEEISNRYKGEQQ